MATRTETELAKMASLIAKFLVDRGVDTFRVTIEGEGTFELKLSIVDVVEEQSND